MAESLATRASRGHRTLCLPIAEETYRRIVADPVEFRRALDDCFRRMPELFPADFAEGYQLKDDRISAKQGVPIRRIITRDGDRLQRPALVPDALHDRPRRGRRGPAVPPQVRRPVLGPGPRLRRRPDVLVSPGMRPGPVQRRRDHRPPGGVARAPPGRRAPSGRSTARRSTSPRPSVAGCVLGAEPAPTAGTDDLKAAYAVFKEEALDITPKYAPRTVNTDGWKGTKAAWKALFSAWSSSSASCTPGSRSGNAAST